MNIASAIVYYDEWHFTFSSYATRFDDVFRSIFFNPTKIIKFLKDWAKTWGMKTWMGQLNKNDENVYLSALSGRRLLGMQKNFY